jgi:hypothetical protein
VLSYLVRRSPTGKGELADVADVTTSLVLQAADAFIGGSGGTRRADGHASVELKGDSEFFAPAPKLNPEIWQSLYYDDHPGFFLVAYGATRRVDPRGDIDLTSRDRFRKPRYQRVAGLFEDYVALASPATWVAGLASRGRLEEGIALLNGLLPADVRGVIEGTSVLFDVAGTRLPFTALSDGYRGFIGWVGDLLHQLTTVTPPGRNLTDTAGVVIVDEIDVHLHPEWQLTVVSDVARALPMLQFFFTSHSPLITGSLESGNILLASIDDEGTRVVRPGREKVHGLSADQILTGAYFNLTSVRSSDAEDDLRQIALRAWKGDETASVEYLKRLARGSEQGSGETA